MVLIPSRKGRRRSEKEIQICSLKCENAKVRKDCKTCGRRRRRRIQRCWL